MSRVELGRAVEAALRTVDAIARALSARLLVSLTWNAESLDRLLDAAHSSLVELVADELRRHGWTVAIEVSFNVRGERGSIDILAFHPAAGVVLVVEVKSVVPDLQAMLFALDRKTRLGLAIARDRGWPATQSARLLVVAEGRTMRRRVAEHAAIFATAFPDRTVAVRRWMRQPDSGRPFSGLWFLSDARQVSARHRVAKPTRVRRACTPGR